MSSDSLELTPRQRLAVPVLAAGGTVDDAAQAAGVAVRTVVRWRARPEFSEAVQGATGELYTEAMRRLADRMPEAARYLGAVADGTEQASVRERINAARLVLQLGSAARESVELAEAVEAIKREMGL